MTPSSPCQPDPFWISVECRCTSLHTLLFSSLLYRVGNFGGSSLFDPSVKYTSWCIKILLMKLPPPDVGPLYLNHHSLDINVIPLFEISSAC